MCTSCLGWIDLCRVSVNVAVLCLHCRQSLAPHFPEGFIGFYVNCEQWIVGSYLFVLPRVLFCSVFRMLKEKKK